MGENFIDIKGKGIDTKLKSKKNIILITIEYETWENERI